MLFIASESDSSGARARFTTIMVIASNATAIAEPIWSCVTMPSQISFISSSHIRLYKDTPESTFAKVTYELVTDEFDPNSQMLVKTESFDVFQMEERKDVSKRTYPLMHGIKTLKFRFYNKNKDNGTWEPSWDSVDSDEDKNIYPDVVEVNFEVYGPSKMYFNGIYDFKPELPFNGIDPSS